MKVRILSPLVSIFALFCAAFAFASVDGGATQKDPAFGGHGLLYRRGPKYFVKNVPPEALAFCRPLEFVKS